MIISVVCFFTQTGRLTSQTLESENMQQCKPGLSVPLPEALTAVCGISTGKWNLSKPKLLT